jgi:hypothetical protein
MRQTVSLVLVLALLTHFGSAASGAESVASQITGIQVGTSVELRLKNKQTLRGTRGEVSASGFTLANPNGGNREITFDEVASVKQLTRKSHTTRNILIGVGIGVVVLVVVVVAKGGVALIPYN